MSEVKPEATTKMYIAKLIYTPGSTIYGYPAIQVDVNEGEEPLVEVTVPTANLEFEAKREGSRLMTKAQYGAIKKAELGE